MERAKTRKDILYKARHLVATAHQALSKKRQTVVAKTLEVADSTVLRRTEKYPEIMDQLAACDVIDFVFEGERKLPLDQYRWLMTVAMQFAKYQLEITAKENAPDAGTFEA